MPDQTSENYRMRSDQRIPKLRTRGRANRERLLAEAQRLIAGLAGQPLRFSDVFEAAGVSRGSAYRIYNGVDDLLQDLASNWIKNFVVFVQQTRVDVGAETWAEVSDRLIAKSVEYWAQTADTVRVLPRVRSNVPRSYKQAVRDLTIAIADIYDRNFVIPEIPDWLAVIGMYTELGDTIFANAVRRDGHVSEHRLVEAQKICRTYLSFYLPDRLPLKAKAEL